MEQKETPIFMQYEMQEDPSDIHNNIFSPLDNSFVMETNITHEVATFITPEIPKDVPTMIDVNKENNNEQMQQEEEHFEINQEQEQHDELNCVTKECAYDDELEEMHMSKLRDCDSSNLMQLLYVETEMLARAKAREETVNITLKCRRQELNEREIHLDQEIQALNELKEKLQCQLEQERLVRQQLEQEMNNTGKIVQVLMDNYNSLKDAYYLTNEDTQKLEQAQNCLFANYNTKKFELLDLVKKEKDELLDIQTSWEKECSEYKREIDEKINTLKKLTEKEENNNKELEDATKIYNDLKETYSKNQSMLAEIRDEKIKLQEEIDCINLEDLQKQKREKEEYYKQVLQDKENELTESKKRLKNLEEKKATVTKELEYEINLTNQLEKTEAELEEERLGLLARKEELGKSIKQIHEDGKANVNKFKIVIQDVDRDITKLEEEVTTIVQSKNEKLQIFEKQKKGCEELSIKLTELENAIEKLHKEEHLSSSKLTERKQHYTSLEDQLQQAKTSLSEEQDKFRVLEKEQDDKLRELNEELKNKKGEIENAQQEIESNNKNLQNELIAYKSESNKIMKENEEKNNKILERLNNDLQQVKDSLSKEENYIEELKLLIGQKTVEHDKLNVTLELSRVESSMDTSAEVSEPVKSKPVGILKSPGKTTSPKNVSWRIPSTSTLSCASVIDNKGVKNKDPSSSSYFDSLLDKNNTKKDLMDEFMKITSDDSEESIRTKRHRIN